MHTHRLETAAVIGTGMMGPGIAVSLALGGLRATILSRAEKTAQAGLDQALRQVARLEENGLAESAAAEHARARLTASTDFDRVIRGADLVVESGPEDMAFKQDLFARMDTIAQPQAVLASNTSGLSITEIGKRCSKPERVLTTHFWNPPYIMPLVEVVKGAKTDPQIAMAVVDLLRRCRKTPVLVKRDTPGQLGNRLQMALVREAIHIVQEGIADADAVDLAAKTGFGLRLPVYGILEHQDMVGLDLGSRVLDYVTQDLNNKPGIPRLMRDLLDRGDLGVKTGRGFYDWSKKNADEVKARRDSFVLEFLKKWY